MIRLRQPTRARALVNIYALNPVLETPLRFTTNTVSTRSFRCKYCASRWLNITVAGGSERMPGGYNLAVVIGMLAQREEQLIYTKYNRPDSVTKQ